MKSTNNWNYYKLSNLDFIIKNAAFSKYRNWRVFLLHSKTKFQFYDIIIKK